MLPLRAQLSRLLAPFLAREHIYAIGIYAGPTPLSVGPVKGLTNPVLSARDVTDVPAHYLADPFMIRAGSTWHMFFELLNRKLNRGQIGLATSSDGRRWRYDRIVLSESFHLSYPYVFAHNDVYYMIPETVEANAVRLYKATTFPHTWAYQGDLLSGGDFFDSSLFQHNGRWWLFTGNNTATNDLLRLFSAPALHGPYTEHPASPIITGNAAIARPGGRVLVDAGRIYRFTQDCAGLYGRQVRAFELTTLTPDQYAEREALPAPLIQPSGTGWNADGMHHIDLHPLGDGSWIACVDGFKHVRYWKQRPAGVLR